MNTGNSPVTLYKGTHIGEVEDASDINIVEPSEEMMAPSGPTLDIGQTFFKDIDLNHACLDDNGKERLMELLLQYRDIFAKDDFDLGRSNVAQHRIPTTCDLPIKQRPYRVPEALKPIVSEHISNMYRKGIISPSHSCWASPITLVKKKDQSWRFCVDYRKLNAVTKKDCFPLPRIDELLDRLGEAKIMSTLDLASGYHQLEVHPDDRENCIYLF